MTPARRFLAICFAAALCSACGAALPPAQATTDSGAPAVQQDGGSAADAGHPVVDAGPPPLQAPSCTGLSTAGVPSISGKVVVGAAPAPRGGGPLPDGRYTCTAYTVYAPASEVAPVGIRGLAEVSQGGATIVEWDPFSQTYGSYLRYSGTTLTLERACPGSGAIRQVEYSVSGSSYQIYMPLGGGRTVVSTYTRQ